MTPIMHNHRCLKDWRAKMSLQLTTATTPTKAHDPMERVIVASSKQTRSTAKYLDLHSSIGEVSSRVEWRADGSICPCAKRAVGNVFHEPMRTMPTLSCMRKAKMHLLCNQAISGFLQRSNYRFGWTAALDSRSAGLGDGAKGLE